MEKCGWNNAHEKMQILRNTKSRRIVKSNFDYHSKVIHGCFFWTSSDGRLAVKIFAERMNALFGAYTRYGYVRLLFYVNCY